MNPAARAIALQALHNYLAGDLELTPDDVGEVLTMALARALALALAEGRIAEVDLDRLLDTVRLVALEGHTGATANTGALRWSE
jgi:hypothetical protein